MTMQEKYREAWKAFLTIYAIYLVTFILLQIIIDFYSLLTLGVILLGNSIALVSTYYFLEGNKINLRKLIRFGIFGIYILFVLANTLVFSIGITESLNYPADIFGFFLSLIELSFPIIALYPVSKILTNLNFSKRNFLNYILLGYLWITGIFLVLALSIIILDISKWTLYDYLTYISLIILLVGIFSYSSKRRIFNRLFWQLYFIISIVWTIVEFAYNFLGLKNYMVLPNYLRSYSTGVESSLYVYVIFSIIFAPLYIPLYKIAFGKNFFKKKLVS